MTAGKIVLIALALLAPGAAFAQMQQQIPSFPRPTMQACAQGQPCPTQAPQFGLRCQTGGFWCGLPQPGPLGASCFCNTPKGPVGGRVSQ